MNIKRLILASFILSLSLSSFADECTNYGRFQKVCVGDTMYATGILRQAKPFRVTSAGHNHIEGLSLKGKKYQDHSDEFYYGQGCDDDQDHFIKHLCVNKEVYSRILGSMAIVRGWGKEEGLILESKSTGQVIKSEHSDILATSGCYLGYCTGDKVRFFIGIKKGTIVGLDKKGWAMVRYANQKESEVLITDFIITKPNNKFSDEQRKESMQELVQE